MPAIFKFTLQACTIYMYTCTVTCKSLEPPTRKTHISSHLLLTTIRAIISTKSEYIFIQIHIKRTKTHVKC